MDRVRIGFVKYLNTLPLVEGLQSWAEAELVAAVPSRLIGMLRGGEVDVALASVVDVVGAGEDSDPSPVRRPPTCAAGGGTRSGGGVIVLPVGMIGSDGPTLTVRLFSKVPIGEIKTVGVDTDSHTSAVLMRVILARRCGLRPRVVDFDARERIVINRNEGLEAERHGGIEAVLLIGDKVVTDPPEGYPHQLDLGQAWKEMTGLPFVYAVWMCREGEEDSVKVRTAAAVLDRQRRHNATRLGWVVGSRAAERHWPEELAGKYVGTYLKYEVGAAEREAVEKFIGWGYELGLCGAGPVRWAEG